MDTSRFFDKYYYVHALLVLGYVLIRLLVPSEGTALTATDEWLGLSREVEVIITLALFLFQKYRKTTNPEAFIAQVLLYTKTALVVLLYLLRTRFAVWYLVIYGILFVVVKPPLYKGPHNCTVFSGPEFENVVLSEGSKTKGSWLVMFTAPWVADCDYALPLFSQISLQYSISALKFGRLDISRYPAIAEKLNISLGSTSKQLPSFILFTNKDEEKRLPPIRPNGDVIATSFDREGLIAYFDLDRRLLEATKQKKK